MAMSEYLPHYAPTYLILYEASQLTEHQVVAVISKHFDPEKNHKDYGWKAGRALHIDTDSEFGSTVMTTFVNSGAEGEPFSIDEMRDMCVNQAEFTATVKAVQLDIGDVLRSSSYPSIDRHCARGRR